jgi:exosortase A
MSRTTVLLAGVYAACAVTVVAYWQTIQSLLAPGSIDGDYTHRILAVPVGFALMWSIRERLGTVRVAPNPWALPVLIALVCVWLVGEFGLIRALVDFSVVALLPTFVVAVMGWRVFAALLFPFMFMLLAVPLRGPIVEYQVALTADFTQWALAASGIPAFREGSFFELPSGNWSVAAACSGVEYLSASLMLAAMFAWQMYEKNAKRIGFVVSVLALALIGNWLRAYLTIAIAHWSGNAYLRHGHGTFGWIFFACLLALACVIGWWYRDNRSDETAQKTTPTQMTPVAFSSFGAQVSAVVVATAIAFSGPLLARNLFPQVNAATDTLALPDAIGPWSAGENAHHAWQPVLARPTKYQSRQYRSGDRTVSVSVGWFANQSWQAKLVTSMNSLVGHEGERGATLTVGRALTGVDTPMFANSALIQHQNTRIIAWQWYLADGTSTASGIEAKRTQVLARLAGKPDLSAWIAIATVADNSGDNSAALRAFMVDAGPALATLLQPR